MFYTWRAKYGGMKLSEVQRLKQIDVGGAKFKVSITGRNHKKSVVPVDTRKQ